MSQIILLWIFPRYLASIYLNFSRKCSCFLQKEACFRWLKSHEQNLMEFYSLIALSIHQNLDLMNHVLSDLNYLIHDSWRLIFDHRVIESDNSYQYFLTHLTVEKSLLRLSSEIQVDSDCWLQTCLLTHVNFIKLMLTHFIKHC